MENEKEKCAGKHLRRKNSTETEKENGREKERERETQQYDSLATRHCRWIIGAVATTGKCGYLRCSRKEPKTGDREHIISTTVDYFLIVRLFQKSDDF